MKKLLFCIAILFFTTTLFAQFGVKGGINVSNISTDNDNVEDLKAKIGYQLGIILDIPISETVWLSPESILVKKGADYTIGATDIETNMIYLDFPITIGYRPKLLPIGIHVGPQFSYLLRTEVNYKNSVLGIETIKDKDRDNYEDFDLGIAIGFDIEINNAFFELRYTHSLKEYEKSTSIGSINIEPASKHFNLQASLGYFF